MEYRVYKVVKSGHGRFVDHSIDNVLGIGSGILMNVFYNSASARAYAKMLRNTMPAAERKATGMTYRVVKYG